MISSISLRSYFTSKVTLSKPAHSLLRCTSTCINTNTNNCIVQKLNCEDTNVKAHDFTCKEEEVDETNQRYKNIVQIKKSLFGRAIFADRDFSKGE